MHYKNINSIVGEGGKMLKHYLGALAVSCSLISVSFSQDYNARLLDVNSEELNTKIFSKFTVSKDTIQESLNFIYKPENLEEKSAGFGAVHSRMISLISDRNFISFAATCQGVYDEGTEETKIAVSMLFESVSDKYHTQFKRFQKLKRIKDQETGSTHNPEYFGKADKTKPLGYSDSLFEITSH